MLLMSDLELFLCFNPLTCNNFLYFRSLRSRRSPALMLLHATRGRSDSIGVISKVFLNFVLTLSTIPVQFMTFKVKGHKVKGPRGPLRTPGGVTIAEGASPYRFGIVPIDSRYTPSMFPGHIGNGNGQWWTGVAAVNLDRWPFYVICKHHLVGFTSL